MDSDLSAITVVIVVIASAILYCGARLQRDSSQEGGVLLREMQFERACLANDALLPKCEACGK